MPKLSESQVLRWKLPSIRSLQQRPTETTPGQELHEGRRDDDDDDDDNVHDGYEEEKASLLPPPHHHHHHHWSLNGDPGGRRHEEK